MSSVEGSNGGGRNKSRFGSPPRTPKRGWFRRVTKDEEEKEDTHAHAVKDGKYLYCKVTHSMKRTAVKSTVVHFAGIVVGMY